VRCKRGSNFPQLTAVTLAHFINRHNTRSVEVKDYEFSRATVT